jgi:hypothetical protein
MEGSPAAGAWRGSRNTKRGGAWAADVSVSRHGQRSGARLATGTGAGDAARRRGAPGILGWFRRASEAADRGGGGLGNGQRRRKGSAARRGARRRRLGLGRARGSRRSPFIGHGALDSLGAHAKDIQRRRPGSGGIGHRWPDGPRWAWQAGAGRAFGLSPDRKGIVF